MTPDQLARIRVAVEQHRPITVYGVGYVPARTRTRTYRLRRWLADRIAP